MKYKKIYSHWVIDDIQDGKKVFCLDRKFLRVVLINDLTVDQMVAMLQSALEESDRYEFWYEEPEETEKVTEETEENENVEVF